MNTDARKTVDVNEPAQPGPTSGFRIEGELTIYTVADWQARIASAFASDADQSTVIDLSRITEIDTAGLQVLLVAHRTAAARGRRLRLTTPASSVHELLRLCRLERLVCEDSDARHASPGDGAA